MDVLGVDPSLSMTGLAKMTASGVVLTKRVPTSKGDGTLSGDLQRIAYITGQVLLFAPKQCLTVIEAPYIPQHNAGSVLERAGLFYFLAYQLAQRGPVISVTAKQRAKYGAGNGNADKAAVFAAVRAAFPGIPLRDDNEADSLALCAMGARHLGAPIDGVPSKAQEQAMAAVVWAYPKGTK